MISATQLSFCIIIQTNNLCPVNLIRKKWGFAFFLDCGWSHWSMENISWLMLTIVSLTTWKLPKRKNRRRGGSGVLVGMDGSGMNVATWKLLERTIQRRGVDGQNASDVQIKSGFQRCVETMSMTRIFFDENDYISEISLTCKYKKHFRNDF